MPANERRAARILVIDDDSEMLGFLSEQLSNRGFFVHSASSAGEALETTREYRLDLLICDLKMPLIDGIGCMEAFHRIDPSLQVILISGEGTIDKAISAIKKGAFDFLQKPLIMEKLLYCIEKALLKKQLEAAMQAYGQTRHLLETSRSDEIFKSTAPLLAQYVSADQCAVFLVDEKGLWQPVSVLGMENREALQKTGHFVKDFCAAKNWQTVPALLDSSDGEVHSSIIVPLIRQECLLGALCLNRTVRKENFTPSDLREAVIFVIQMTQATESLRMEKALHEKMAELGHAYETLETSKDVLNQKEKLAQLGNMIATIAHEISNPLTAILGYADLILRSGPIDPEVRDHLGIVYSEAERCKTMLQEVLMYSHHRKPRLFGTRIRQIVEDVLHVMRPEFIRLCVKVSVEGAAADAEVLADANLLKQVFLNLIKNALQAMGGQREKKLEINITCPDDFVVVAIRDHGPGIPLDVLKKIFDPYFTTKRSAEGTGLGLSIASEIMHEHSGRLTAHNASNGGAVFCVELPNTGYRQKQSLGHAA